MPCVMIHSIFSLTHIYSHEFVLDSLISAHFFFVKSHLIELYPFIDEIEF